MGGVSNPGSVTAGPLLLAMLSYEEEGAGLETGNWELWTPKP